MSLMIHLASVGKGLRRLNIFFLECARYQNIRLHLIDKINSVKPCSLDLMLFGDKTLPKNANQYIFDAVHCYIEESNRFS